MSFSDRTRLQTGAYASDSKLAARQAIYRFAERPAPSGDGRVRGVLALRGDEVVVDVGCGNGNDIRDLQRTGFAGPIFGFDLSVGMLHSLPGRDFGVADANRDPERFVLPVANADAGALPLRTGAVDVALAMHMLYHCPDIEATAAELRRVIRPGGALVASTNGARHLHELRELWTNALSDAAGREVDPWETASGRFTLENGPSVLATAFDTVDVHPGENRLLVPEVDAVVDYVESTRDLSGHDLDDDVWGAAVELLRSRVEDVIREHGALAIGTSSGMFVCR